MNLGGPMLKGQILGSLFLLAIVILFIVGVVFFVRGVILRRQLNKTVLPSVELEDKDEYVEEEGDEKSFFDLESLGESNVKDMASYQILEDVKKVQESRGIQNPFRRGR